MEDSNTSWPDNTHTEERHVADEVKDFEEDNTGCLGCLGYVLFLVVIFALLLLHSLV